MWVHLQQSVTQVVKYVKSDVKLSSLCTFVQLTNSVVFLLLGVIPVLDTASMNSQIECIIEAPFAMTNAIQSYCLIKGIFIGSADKFWSLTYYVWVPYVITICFFTSQVGFLLYRHIFPGNILSMLLDSVNSVKHMKSYCKKLLTYERIRADSYFWVLSFIAYEFITFSTPMIQLYFLNVFLGGQFLLFGIGGSSAFNVVFPKLAKCNFYKFGPSGSLQNHDALCVLSNNIRYEKIFFCAWWWLVFATALSIIGIAWRLVTYCCFKLSFINWILWSDRFEKEYMCKLSKIITFSEWLFIYNIYKNLSTPTFRILLRNCDKELNIEDIENKSVENEVSNANLSADSNSNCDDPQDNNDISDQESYITAYSYSSDSSNINENTPLFEKEDNDGNSLELSHVTSRDATKSMADISESNF